MKSMRLALLQLISLVAIPHIFPCGSALEILTCLHRRALLFSSFPSMVIGTWSSPPLRVALLGAGLFARRGHAPILKKYPDKFDCVGVWSFSNQEAAETVAEELGCAAFSGTTGLDRLLDDESIDAVIIALPLDVQPSYVRQALSKSKHVLSEKPIAATVRDARELTLEYETHYQNLHWSVAEHFRYETVFSKLQSCLSDIGELITVNLVVHAPFLEDNVFLNTPWRKRPSWKGGLFIDSFVHWSAAIRKILGEREIVAVSARTSSHAPYLPPPDTMVAQVEWSGSLIGTISVTYACEERRVNVEITGTRGRASVESRSPAEFAISYPDGSRELVASSGIEAEFLAFADACRGTNNKDVNTPKAAIEDLRVVEACLASAALDGRVVKLNDI